MVYVRLMCTANFIALNLEAYEVVSQLIFGQSKIGFAENFLPPQPWRLRSGLSHQRSAWTTCFPRTASLSAGRKGSNPIATAGGPAPPQDGHAGQGGHIMDTLPLFAPPCGHAALAAPKPLMASRLSTVLSSALCAWPSHPHGAFFAGPSLFPPSPAASGENFREAT